MKKLSQKQSRGQAKETKCPELRFVGGHSQFFFIVAIHLSFFFLIFEQLTCNDTSKATFSRGKNNTVACFPFHYHDPYILSWCKEERLESESTMGHGPFTQNSDSVYSLKPPWRSFSWKIVQFWVQYSFSSSMSRPESQICLISSRSGHELSTLQMMSEANLCLLVQTEAIPQMQRCC